jgi:hypothetical protein
MFNTEGGAGKAAAGETRAGRSDTGAAAGTVAGTVARAGRPLGPCTAAGGQPRWSLTPWSPARQRPCSGRSPPTPGTGGST